MARLTAAYGLFYLENRPVLLRAAEVRRPATAALLEAVREAGFNALRPADEGLVDRSRAARFGLAVVDPEVAGYDVGAACERPFGVSLLAQRATSRATESEPAALWGLAAEPAAVMTAVGRGVRGYSVAAPPEAWPALAPLQRWLGETEEELTASVAVQDAVACLETPGSAALLEGGFAVLALAGFNPTLVDLLSASDADLAEFPAALFPTDGVLDVPDYGKLVVLTLRGATMVTYPQPVQRTPEGIAYRTTFLWPAPSKGAGAGAGGGEQRALGRRVQVRDGVSTLLTEPFGEPYGGAAYSRLPAGQRTAHRDLALALFAEAVMPALEPDRQLEVEHVARLSPDGGALLFVVNRLGAQSGRVRLADLPTLRLSPEFKVETLFTGSGSSARREGDGVGLTLAASDALVVRLG
ncbi:MAG TPA: hypothetical protein VFN74_22665 [Chloroflexota bacterium]|nr:hypothetical protein [Chloroflexota bacterium]